MIDFLEMRAYENGAVVSRKLRKVAVEKGLDKKRSIGYIFAPYGSSDPDGTQIARKPKVCFLKRLSYIYATIIRKKRQRHNGNGLEEALVIDNRLKSDFHSYRRV
jgi:hypothetical protein